MRTRISLAFWLCVSVAVCAIATEPPNSNQSLQKVESQQTAPQSPTDLPPIKIAMIGDSTMASYSKPPEDKPTLTGWGQVF